MSLCCFPRKAKRDNNNEENKKTTTKGNKTKKKDESEHPTKDVSTRPEVQSNNREETRMVEKETTTLLTLPVNIEQLSNYVTNTSEMRRHHESIPRGQLRTCNRAQDPDVIDKNRYNKVVPYDHTRVVLEKVPNQPGSDYINASYIDGYRRQKAYIATQGPKENTCADFWRMVWQENVCKIVMLTNLIESGKRKCDIYWPQVTDKSPATFGDIIIEHDRLDNMADYSVRTMFINKKGEPSSKRRCVKQFHFTSWPDHGVPMYPCVLVSFLKKIKAYEVPNSGPIVVHCSAGLGRSGTVILLDSMLDMGRVEGRIDCVQHLHKMRLQRPNILDNYDQYELVHLALVEALIGEETSVSCAQFPTVYESLWKYPNGCNNQKTRMQQQFDRITRQVLDDDNCRTGMDPANAQKNRINRILPEERHRPYLKPNPWASGDYINAVYVSGYNSKDAFVVTQFPLPDTIVDFWRLVADHNCSVVVVLNDLKAGNPDTPRFWPEDADSPLVYPFMSVHVNSVSSEFEGVTWKFQFLYKTRAIETVRQVTLIEFRGWNREENIPPSAEKILRLIDHVTDAKRTTEPPGNVLVTCYDGSTASGLFCACSFLSDKIRTEQEVDVFLAARTIVGSRPSFLEKIEQYAFCHEVALSYINSFETYSNFR